jgi:large subunit ribosomal protein L9
MPTSPSQRHVGARKLFISFDPMLASLESRFLRGAAQLTADKIAGQTLVMPAKIGAKGRLFGSITAADVALAVTKCGGPAVDKKAVELRGAVKTVGSHKASIKLHPGVTASVTFEVVAV